MSTDGLGKNGRSGRILPISRRGPWTAAVNEAFPINFLWAILGAGERTRKQPVKISRKHLLIAVCVCVGVVMNGRAAFAQQNSPPISSEDITRILASPDRSPADRTNDLRRHPQQMLEFIGIHPGIVAVDLSAAGGYTTELLARTIGPSGAVYGQSRPRDPEKPPTAPAASEGNSHPNVV